MDFLRLENHLQSLFQTKPEELNISLSRLCSKVLMEQVSEKSNPKLPNVGLRYILVEYIKRRSPWRKGWTF